jgi:GT2 family glycosyltransferase
MRQSVVIPTLRRPEMLAETLASIGDADPAPDEVIVVDGDPAASAAPVVRATLPRARHVASGTGLTLQRNVGIAAATGDVIVFLDDDVTVAADLFARLVEPFSEPGIVGVTGRVVESSARQIGGRRDSRMRRLLIRANEGAFTSFGYPRYVSEDSPPLDVEFAPGGLLAVRRELAAEVGCDERLTGSAIAEDEDFSFRLSRHGRIRYLPTASVVHRKTGFHTRDPRAFGRSVVVNRAYLFHKNFPQSRTAVAQFWALIVVLFAHRLANRAWQEALGILDGARAVRRGIPLP